MKKRNLCSDRKGLGSGWRPVFGRLAVVACFGLLQTGCEVDSAGKVDVQITPQYAEVRRGQSIELTASGWDDYEWAMSNRQLGHLSKKFGHTVVYTATKNIPRPAANVTNTTETFNTISAAAVVSTNRTNKAAYSTSMRIKHLPD